MLVRFLTVLVVLACGGCQAPLVIVPDDIGSRGLLVGELCDIGGGPVDFYADPIINQRKFIGGMRQKYLTVPLAPGSYTLERFHESAGGNAIISFYAEYPINVNFTIESQQATSIGLLVMHPKPHRAPPGVVASGTGATPYRVVVLDNTDEMASLLHDLRPQLYQSLRPNQPMSSLRPPADPTALARVRETIIATRFEQDIRQGREPSAYVTGCAGTIGRMTKNANGQASLRALPTNTLANLSACNAVGDRLACLISREKYISVIGDKVTHERLPAEMNANTLHAVSKDRLVLIDDSMNIYTSVNNGAQWTKYTGAAFAEPLGRDYRGDPKNRFGMHAGASGFYIYGVDLNAEHSRLLRGDYRTGEFRNLNLPPKVDYLSTVRETRAGLFVAPSMTHLTKGKLQFLPTGSNVWQQRDAPTVSCYDLAFPDDSGANLQALCSGDNNVWSSADGGVTWKRMFRADSLFALP